jgi:hypothetical protein
MGERYYGQVCKQCICNEFEASRLKTRALEENRKETAQHMMKTVNAALENKKPNVVTKWIYEISVFLF